MHRSGWFVTFASLVCPLIALFLCGAASAGDKLPIPPQAAQDESLKLLKDIYKSQYAEPSAAGKKKLASDLLEQGKKTTDDPTGRFVLFTQSRDLALQSSDVTGAFNAIDQLDSLYVIDARSMKIAAVAAVAPRASSADSAAIAKSGLDLLDQCLQSESFPEAVKLIPSVNAVVLKSKDEALRLRFKDLQSALADAEKVKPALEKLKTDALDTSANLAAGRYYCFIKGDFDKGIPLLSLGSDVKLKTLAFLDKSNPSDGSRQKDLADGWYDYAQGQTGSVKANSLSRATFWYTKAQANLSGLAKVAVEKRLAQIGSAPAGATVSRDPRPGEWIDLLKLTDPKDAPPGDWSMNASVLSNTNGDKVRVIPVPVHCDTAYELQVTFVRTTGDNAVAFAFPAGSGKAELLLSAWHGDCSMMGVVGQDLRNNATTVRPGTLQNKHEYKLVIRVIPKETDVSIDVELDGKPYMKYQGPQASLSHIPGWNLPSGKTLGFGAQECLVAISSARMRSETGKITLLRQPIPDTSSWADLLKPVDLDKHVVKGRESWSREPSGAIKTAYTGQDVPPRVLMLPAATDGSYDLQVKFTRNEGIDTPGIILPVGSTRVKFDFSYYGGEHAGLNSIDGKNPGNQPPELALHPARLINVREYTADFHVVLKDANADITLNLNGERYFHWAGAQSSLSCGPMPDPHAFGLLTWKSSVTFSAVRVKMITGQLREVRK